MCRFLVYFGNERILLADLVTKPKHSIVHQSFEAAYLPFLDDSTKTKLALNHKINGDGFGVAWYDREESVVPCVFTSIKPSWNDVNLQRLATYVRSNCIFSHVRAASPRSLIVDTNCHPFQAGRILFMHNGCIAHFGKIKKRLISGLSERCFALINGTTDTEHAFAIFVSHLPDEDPSANHSIHILKGAMLNTIQDLLKLTMLCGEKPQASSMNFAVSNGEVVIATRFRNSHREEPPSLYISKTVRYECPNSTDPSSAGNTIPTSSSSCFREPTKSLSVPDFARSGDLPSKLKSVVICSEPLSYNEDQWALVPKNHLLIVTTNHKVKVEAIEVDSKFMIAAESVPAFVPLLKGDIFNLKITRTASNAALHPYIRSSKSELSNDSKALDESRAESPESLLNSPIVRSSTVELLTPRLGDQDTRSSDQTQKTTPSDLAMNFQVVITRDSLMKMMSLFLLIQVALFALFVK